MRRMSSKATRKLAGASPRWPDVFWVQWWRGPLMRYQSEHIMSQQFKVNTLNHDDPEAVYDWAFGACLMGPLEYLSSRAGTTSEDPTLIAEGFSRAFFPAESQAAARDGCLAGFAERERRRATDGDAGA